MSKSRFARKLEEERNWLIRLLVLKHGIPEDEENFDIALRFCQDHLAPHNNRFREPSRKRCEDHIASLIERFALRSELRSSEALFNLFQAFKNSVESETINRRRLDNLYGRVQLLYMLAQNSVKPERPPDTLEKLLKLPDPTISYLRDRFRDAHSFLSWEELNARRMQREASSSNSHGGTMWGLDDPSIYNDFSEWEADYHAAKSSDDDETCPPVEGAQSQIENDVQAEKVQPTENKGFFESHRSRSQTRSLLAYVSVEPPEWLDADLPPTANFPWHELQNAMSNRTNEQRWDDYHEHDVRASVLQEHMIAMLEGYPSETFEKDVDGFFHTMDHVCVKHLSSASLVSTIDAALQTANQIQSLRNFCQDYARHPSRCFQAFAHSVRQQVDTLDQALTAFAREGSEPRHQTLIRLHSWISDVSPGLRLILSIMLQVVRKENTKIPEHEGKYQRSAVFRNGSHSTMVARLLNTLCSNMDTLGLSGSPLLPVATQLFRDTVLPYMRMVDQLLTSGSVDDPASEFMLRQRRLQAHSNYFWDETLRFDDKLSECAPNFLQGCASELLYTGKALRLINTIKMLQLRNVTKRSEDTVSDMTSLNDDASSSTKEPSVGHLDPTDSALIVTGKANMYKETKSLNANRFDTTTLDLIDNTLAKIHDSASTSLRSDCKLPLKIPSKEGVNVIPQNPSDASPCNSEQREQKWSLAERGDSLSTSAAFKALHRLVTCTTTKMPKVSNSGAFTFSLVKGPVAAALLGHVFKNRNEPIENDKESTRPNAIEKKTHNNNYAGSTPSQLFYPMLPKIFKLVANHVFDRHREVGLMLARILNNKQTSLRSYFYSLRNFFLMASGETALHFQESLFPYIRDRRWPHTQVLQDILRDSLQIESTCESMLDGRLRIAAATRPPRRKSGSCDAMEWISTIRFECDVPWPISLIVSPEAVESYSEVFKFLLMIHYAKWTLDRLSMLGISRSRRMRQGTISSFHTFYSLRAKMHHLVGCFQVYMTNSAVRESWLQFDDKLKGVLQETCDLPKIREEHEKYLGNIQRHMLLQKKFTAAMRKIQSTLAICIQLEPIHHLLLTSARDVGHQEERFMSIRVPSRESIMSKMHKIQGIVDSDIKFLLVVLREIISHGVQLHLKKLMLTLDFNRYFSANREKKHA